MAYNRFTLAKVTQDFHLTLREVNDFLPPVPAVTPSVLLRDLLLQNIPWAVAVGSEKARSEAIINPVLLEVRRLLVQQVSVFSGEEFTVDPERGLSGYCDFLISKSAQQMFIQAPAIVVVEAKRDDLKPGLGQCAAAMVAAQMFNEQRQKAVGTIYGSVSTGTQWRFLKLEANCLTINLLDHTVPPVDTVLGILLWMLQDR